MTCPDRRGLKNGRGGSGPVVVGFHGGGESAGASDLMVVSQRGEEIEPFCCNDFFGGRNCRDRWWYMMAVSR